MAQTVNDKGMKYPVAADVDAKTENAYHVDGYPDYYLIDRSGKLRVADCANGRSRKRFKRFLRRAKRRRRDRFLLHPRSSKSLRSIENYFYRAVLRAASEVH